MSKLKPCDGVGRTVGFLRLRVVDGHKHRRALWDAFDRARLIYPDAEPPSVPPVGASSASDSGSYLLIGDWTWTWIPVSASARRKKVDAAIVEALACLWDRGAWKEARRFDRRFAGIWAESRQVPPELIQRATWDDLLPMFIPWGWCGVTSAGLFWPERACKDPRARPVPCADGLVKLSPVLPEPGDDSIGTWVYRACSRDRRWMPTAWVRGYRSDGCEWCERYHRVRGRRRRHPVWRRWAFRAWTTRR